ncbi:MAG: HhH-GPD-type base excision DNA repair protein [Nocardioides sp.]
MAFQIAQDPAADAVLTDSPFALLLGMLLDQQYKMEDAFKGGHKLLTRLGHLDPQQIAAMDPEAFKEIASQTPAIHRFPASMAAKVQEVARIVTEQYGGDASRIWTEATSGPDLLKRMQALPGFGKQKAQIFVALLAKQVGVRPEGWEKAVGAYAEDGFRSVADVVDGVSLQKVRDYKQAAKAAAKAAPGAPVA